MGIYTTSTINDMLQGPCTPIAVHPPPSSSSSSSLQPTPITPPTATTKTTTTTHKAAPRRIIRVDLRHQLTYSHIRRRHEQVLNTTMHIGHATPAAPLVVRSRESLNAAFAGDAALVKAALNCGTFSAMMNTRRADHLPYSGINVALSGDGGKGGGASPYWRVFVAPDADAEFAPSAHAVLLCGIAKLAGEFDWVGFLRWRQHHPVLQELAAVCAENGTLRGWILTPDEVVVVTFKLTLNGRLAGFATRVAYDAVVAHDDDPRRTRTQSQLSVKMALFGHAMDEFCERFRLDGCELESRLSRNLIKQINVAGAVPLLAGGVQGSHGMADVRRSSRAGYGF